MLSPQIKVCSFSLRLPSRLTIDAGAPTVPREIAVAPHVAPNSMALITSAMRDAQLLSPQDSNMVLAGDPLALATISVASSVPNQGEPVPRVSFLPLNFFQDTITSPFLDSLGLVINRVHKTLICMACGVSVDPLAVPVHFKLSAHKSHKPAASRLDALPDEISRLFPRQLVHPPHIPGDIVDVVFGLAPPLPSHVQCSHCKRWFKGPSHVSDSFRKHKCGPGHAERTRTVSRTASVQQFSAANTSRRFPVQMPVAAQEAILSPWDQYQLQRAQRPVKPPRVSIPENHRVLHQFLFKEGFVSHLEGQSPADLQTLHHIDLTDLQYPNLARHVEYYLLNLQKKRPSTHIRRLIGTRPNAE